MSLRGSIRGRNIVVVVALALLALTSAPAQEATAPKVDIFAGYSWLNPGGSVGNPQFTLPGISQGFDTETTFNLNRFLGITADFGGHFGDQANMSTFLFGPRLMLRNEQLSPFLHGLVGLARLSPAGLGTHNGFAAAVGGGLDLHVTRHFSLRLIEADYLYNTYNNLRQGGSSNATLNSARLQGGIVLGLGGGKPPIPPSATCSVQPTAVMAGEPVTATVQTKDFNPKHTLTYNWTASGGKVAGKETTATVDTTGLAPGSYTVTARVADPKMKKGGEVTCNTSFTINEPPKHPPTISCSANPTTVRSGDASTITCQAASPDNRPLTVTHTATGGRVSGTGPTATLDTAGAPAGPITVTSTVTDDRGLTAQTTTSVTVEVPPPPPQASKLNEIAFKVNNARVDNTAKAILDDVALRLQRDADAKAVVVGYFDPKEKNGQTLASQRAVNTKTYLTAEKGIDPSRIETRTGTAGGTRAEIWLVPAGATFTEAGTTPVDESKVKAAPSRPARGARKPAAKKPAAKTP